MSQRQEVESRERRKFLYWLAGKRIWLAMKYDHGFNARWEPRYGRQTNSYHPILDILARLFPRTFSDGTFTLWVIWILCGTGVACVAYLALSVLAPGTVSTIPWNGPAWLWR